MPTTDLIICCTQCGFINLKVNLDGFQIDEEVRALARSVLTEEHAASHQAEKESDGE